MPDLGGDAPASRGDQRCPLCVEVWVCDAIDAEQQADDAGLSTPGPEFPWARRRGRGSKEAPYHRNRAGTVSRAAWLVFADAPATRTRTAPATADGFHGRPPSALSANGGRAFRPIFGWARLRG